MTTNDEKPKPKPKPKPRAKAKPKPAAVENESSGVIKSEVKRSAASGGIRKDILIMEAVPGNGQRPNLILTDEGAEYVAKLAGYGCTQEEIASDVGVHFNTLNNVRNRAKFKAAVERGKLTFTQSIRANQMVIMKRGSAAMAIFLGKNYLGQTDRANIEVNEYPMEAFVAAIQSKANRDDETKDDETKDEDEE